MNRFWPYDSTTLWPKDAKTLWRKDSKTPRTQWTRETFWTSPRKWEKQLGRNPEKRLIVNRALALSIKVEYTVGIGFSLKGIPPPSHYRCIPSIIKAWHLTLYMPTSSFCAIEYKSDPGVFRLPCSLPNLGSSVVTTDVTIGLQKRANSCQFMQPIERWHFLIFSKYYRQKKCVTGWAFSGLKIRCPHLDSESRNFKLPSRLIVIWSTRFLLVQHKEWVGSHYWSLWRRQRFLAIWVVSNSRYPLTINIALVKSDRSRFPYASYRVGITKLPWSFWDPPFSVEFGEFWWIKSDLGIG